MTAPTTEELQGLVAKARREHGKDEADHAAAAVKLQRTPVMWFWANHIRDFFGDRDHFPGAPQPEKWRSFWLHIALFALRAAWEAGRRMGAGRVATTMAGDTVWIDEENVAHPMRVNSTEPDKAPAPSPPTPSPPSPDVDALLAEADEYTAWPGAGITALVAGLARALRAERERRRGLGRFAHEANAHLRAVLAHGWPEGTTGPACVRAARAFLDGRADDAAATASDVGPVRGECPKTAGEAAALLLQNVAGNYSFDTAMSSPWAPQFRVLLEQSGKLSHWWLEMQRLETRKALAAQNQAETRLAELEEAIAKLAAGLRGQGKG